MNDTRPQPAPDRDHEPAAAPPRNFRDLVWDVVRSIPPGRVMTYGQIAAALGTPRSAHAVGYMLSFIPEVGRVPCQRVVNRYGGLAAAYGWGSVARHREDLLAEGVEVREDYTVDLDRYRWEPDPEQRERWALENLRRLHEPRGGRAVE